MLIRQHSEIHIYIYIFCTQDKIEIYIYLSHNDSIQLHIICCGGKVGLVQHSHDGMHCRWIFFISLSSVILLFIVHIHTYILYVYNSVKFYVVKLKGHYMPFQHWLFHSISKSLVCKITNAFLIYLFFSLSLSLSRFCCGFGLVKTNHTRTFSSQRLSHTCTRIDVNMNNADSPQQNTIPMPHEHQRFTQCCAHEKKITKIVADVPRMYCEWIRHTVSIDKCIHLFGTRKNTHGSLYICVYIGIFHYKSQFNTRDTAFFRFSIQFFFLCCALSLLLLLLLWQHRRQRWRWQG